MVHINKSSVLKWPPQSPDHGLMGCGRKADSNPGCAANQSQRITCCHNNNMNQNVIRVLLEYHQI